MNLGFQRPILAVIEPFRSKKNRWSTAAATFISLPLQPFCPLIAFNRPLNEFNLFQEKLVCVELEIKEWSKDI